MLKTVTGDLLESTETFLCHQCNCVTMRSMHLAKSVFARFPYADIYSNRTEHDHPGNVIVRGDGITTRLVVNILGQYYPGKSRYPNGKRDGVDARLEYFSSALEQMKVLEGNFAFPHRIGCGAAGGRWEDYYALLANFESSIKGDVVIYRLPCLESSAVDHPKLF